MWCRLEHARFFRWEVAKDYCYLVYTQICNGCVGEMHTVGTLSGRRGRRKSESSITSITFFIFCLDEMLTHLQRHRRMLAVIIWPAISYDRMIALLCSRFMTARTSSAKKCPLSDALGLLLEAGSFGFLWTTTKPGGAGANQSGTNWFYDLSCCFATYVCSNSTLHIPTLTAVIHYHNKHDGILFGCSARCIKTIGYYPIYSSSFN